MLSKSAIPDAWIALNDCGRYTIIDEADEMVSADWVDDMRRIMAGGGKYMSIHFFIDDF